MEDEEKQLRLEKKRKKEAKKERKQKKKRKKEEKSDDDDEEETRYFCDGCKKIFEANEQKWSTDDEEEDFCFDCLFAAPATRTRLLIETTPTTSPPVMNFVYQLIVQHQQEQKEQKEQQQQQQLQIFVAPYHSVLHRNFLRAHNIGAILSAMDLRATDVTSLSTPRDAQRVARSMYNVYGIENVDDKKDEEEDEDDDDDLESSSEANRRRRFALTATLDNRIYKRIHMPDVSCPSLLDGKADEIVREALQFIDEHVRSNRNVLVHCERGQRRSPILTMLYLMSFQNLTLQKCLSLFGQQYGDEWLQRFKSSRAAWLPFLKRYAAGAGRTLVYPK